MPNDPRVSDAPSLIEQRQVRVFVSSTFRDMQAERDHLVKFIFPQLRKLCESRGVTWGEVDLRWGITEEQAAEGRVLPLCLAEIAGCQPYFIGLLGERYGWVPQEIDPELARQQPWLAEHRQHSVTELEILHGVLNDPTMADHAFFYFRAPAYARGVDPARRADFLSESPEAASKLASLKDRIRQAHAEGRLARPPRENYADPDALGSLVLADFTALIERLYPAEAVPDAVERERQAHEAYAHSRTRAYVPRPDYTRRLDAYAAGRDHAPCVLLGESGSGKSALLADWAARYRAAHPNALVILHFIGGTADSADWVQVLRRIMGELKKTFRLPDEIPFEPARVREAFPDWLTNAAGRGPVIIVLDALNQLEDNDAAPDLGWLPNYWPPNVRFIFSTLPSRALEAIRRRGWLAPESTIELPLFTPNERHAAIEAFLRLCRKDLSDAPKVRLADAPQCANPLFLRATLDELRQFGEYDRLDERIGYYLAASDPVALFTRILERWRGDYSAGRDLVRQALCLIAASRRGLSEAELLDLLGERGEPLPRAHWTPFYLAAESALASRGGLLNFGHAYLQAAVGTLWLGPPEATPSFRQRLAAYFGAIPEPTDRKLDELPEHLLQLQSWDALKDLLTDIPTFLRMSDERRKWDLHRYWLTLAPHYSPARAYSDSLEAWARGGRPDSATSALVLNNVAAFHYERADHASAEPLYRRALAIDEESFGPDNPRVAIRLSNLAELLRATNRPSEAEPLIERALAIDEGSLGPDHPNLAIRLNNLAQLLKDTNRLSEAEPLMRRALTIDEASFGPEHPNVARSINNLAGLLYATNRLGEAEPLMRRVVDILERSLGRQHPNVASALNNLAQLLEATNRLSEAEPLMRRALTINEASFGPGHPDVARSINNLAGLLYATNRLGEAEPLMRRALAVDEARLGPRHPDVAIDLNNLAQLLKATDRLSEAEPLMRRALGIDEASHGPDHPALARGLNNLAGLLQTTNRLSEAEPLLRRVVAIFETSLGSDHPHVAAALNNLAVLLQATNRLSKAEPLMRRALAIEEASFGPEHPNVALRLNNLAQLLKATDRLSEAERLMRRALAIDEASFGPGHQDVGRDLHNLSQLLQDTSRVSEAERLARRALAIDEASFGPDHQDVARDLNNLARLLYATNRLSEAAPLTRRMLGIFLTVTRATGHPHPHLRAAIGNYAALLRRMGRSEEEVLAQLNAVAEPFGTRFGG